MCKNDPIRRTERQIFKDKLREIQGLWDTASLPTNMWVEFQTINEEESTEKN